MAASTCLSCLHYRMSSGEEVGRTRFDRCARLGKELPASAYCYEDTCCPTAGGYSNAALRVLEEVAEACPYFEEPLDGTGG